MLEIRKFLMLNACSFELAYATDSRPIVLAPTTTHMAGKHKPTCLRLVIWIYIFWGFFIFNFGWFASINWHTPNLIHGAFNSRAENRGGCTGILEMFLTSPNLVLNSLPINTLLMILYFNHHTQVLWQFYFFHINNYNKIKNVK